MGGYARAHQYREPRARARARTHKNIHTPDHKNKRTHRNGTMKTSSKVALDRCLKVSTKLAARDQSNVFQKHVLSYVRDGICIPAYSTCGMSPIALAYHTAPKSSKDKTRHTPSPLDPPTTRFLPPCMTGFTVRRVGRKRTKIPNHVRTILLNQAPGIRFSESCSLSGFFPASALSTLTLVLLPK